MIQQFIAENKWVLFPPAVFDAQNFEQPKLLYRWLYIFIAWLIISVILGFYGELLVPVVPDQGFYREFFMCAGQLVFQTVCIGHLTKGRLIHYLGNMMTVSLIGSFLLLPPLFFGLLTGYENPWLYVAYFLVIVAVIIWIHKVRVERLDLHWIITVSWVIYRIILLAIIYIIG